MKIILHLSTHSCVGAQAGQILVAVLIQLCFDALRGMRNGAKTLFWNQLTCNLADPVGFIFDTYEGILQLLDKFFLA